MAGVISAAVPAIGSVCEVQVSVVKGPGVDGNLRSSFVPAFRHNFARSGRAGTDGLKIRSNGVRAQAVSVAEAPKVSQVVQWQESKRIQTQSVVIGPETKTIRSLDWDRDRFDMCVAFRKAKENHFDDYLLICVIDLLNSCEHSLICSHERSSDLGISTRIIINIVSP